MVDPAKRPKIAIGICTRQRNTLLRILLESIWAQPAPPNYEVAVIIVDNNDSQEIFADSFDLDPKFALTIVHEANPGMVAARNHALDLATDGHAEWFIGVDDDETVESDWLAQFIIGLETLDAAIIVAARRIVYPDTANPFIEHIQQLQEPAGEETKVYSTANFAMHKSVFDSDYGPGLRFHPALNESGGVDFELMLRAKYQHGIISVNWPHAVTVELFDGKRATLTYSLRRRLLNQARRYQIADLHRISGVRGTRSKHALRITRLTIRFFVLGIAALICGICLILIRHKDAYQLTGSGLRKLARAFGIVPYLMGKSVINYGAKTNADRSR